jgi:ribosomal protein L40E
MPMPLKPRTYRCVACGWSRTVAPRSDALMPWDTVSRCAKCGSDNLRTEPSAALSGALASGLEVLGRLLRR